MPQFMERLLTPNRCLRFYWYGWYGSDLNKKGEEEQESLVGRGQDYALREAAQENQPEIGETPH